ncbi:MAG: 3-hydroxybenzoate 6-monooxygenase [Pseudomonadota bacterium]|nr:3-hydroxybenzoate 6-monooxygenase [Pseudomonadota bacterium]
MMQISAENPILIAGGGIGGCAAALALSLKGYPTVVMEQANEFAEIGAGIQLGPNVHKMFVHLGIEKAIKEIAFYPSNIFMNDGITGEQITQIETGKKFRERFGAPYGVIHRADLLDVLVDSCKKSKLIEMNTSTEVEKFKEADGSVTVTTKDGRDFKGGALIAADGLWSKIRSKIIDDGDPIISGHIAYRAVLPIAEVPEFIKNDDVVLWAGPKFHLVHYKLRRGELFNIVAVFHSDKYEEGWDAFGDPKELHARFRDAKEEVKNLLNKINSWKMWVLCDREPVKVWSKGKITLLGDAAHPMLQYLAAGAGMAIEDAVVLAHLLQKNDSKPEKTFKDYQQIRYLRTGRVQATARIYGQIYHASNVVGELRTQMFKDKNPQNYDGIAWLYDGIEI